MAPASRFGKGPAHAPALHSLERPAPRQAIGDRRGYSDRRWPDPHAAPEPAASHLVRLNDSRLVVWSAIALDERETATFEAFNRPAFLIVPNDHHRLDARAWKDRYPQMQVVAPEGSRAKVEGVAPVDKRGADTR